MVRRLIILCTVAKVLLEVTQPPSEQPCTLVVSMFTAGEARAFDLSIFSSEAVQAAPLW